MTDVAVAGADAIASGAVDGAMHWKSNAIAACVLDRRGRRGQQPYSSQPPLATVGWLAAWREPSGLSGQVIQ
jgi:hypothetical protein